MMGRSAAIVGGATWAFLCHKAGTPSVVFASGLPVALVASVLPDIDSPNSHAAQALGPFRRIVQPVIAKTMGGHRRGTHSLLVAALLSAGAVILARHYEMSWLGYAFAVGYVVGGIATDVVTRDGVALLWPFTTRTFRIARLRTGAAYEMPLVVAYAALIAYIIAGSPTWPT